MPADPSSFARAPHATCLACGCLCDDIEVAVAGGRVVGADRACRIGLPWFLAPDPNEGHPSATIEGRAVGVDEALGRAAAILGAARSPMVWGLTGSSVEAVGAALGLADRLGAAVDLAGSAARAGHRAALVRLGAVSATLGEVRDRSEVVLFWGGHPDATHPRHGERYSIAPRGRFLDGPRLVVVVDVGEAEAVGQADSRLRLDPDRQAAALRVLLARARGVTLDPARVERSTGVPLTAWDDLLGLFRASRHGAIFFGPAAAALDATGWDAALTLIRDLNADGRRCVGLRLGDPGNAAGAAAICTWQAGGPGSLDFGPGFPEHLPGEATLAARLDRGEVDAVLLVGADPTPDLTPHQLARLGSIPTIRIAPGPPAGPGWTPTVAIAVGRLGIEAGGTVARVDGVMLPLRPPLAGASATDHAILRALADRLDSAGGPSPQDVREPDVVRAELPAVVAGGDLD